MCEVYAASDGHKRFVHDFVKVWNKVMMLDRYDVRETVDGLHSGNKAEHRVAQIAAV